MAGVEPRSPASPGLGAREGERKDVEVGWLEADQMGLELRGCFQC